MEKPPETLLGMVTLISLGLMFGFKMILGVALEIVVVIILLVLMGETFILVQRFCEWFYAYCERLVTSIKHAVGGK